MTSDSERKDEVREAVLTACRSIMRPLTRFLVRNGIGFREFAEITKEAFVEIVSSDYGIRGRQTNVSRAAVLTGLTRKEVSRIRRTLSGRDPVEDVPCGRPAKVLDAWYHLPEFQSPDGRPLDLPFEGPPRSFVELVRTSGGDIPPRAMLKELVHAGSVLKLQDEKYRVVSKTFIPDPADAEAVKFAGQAMFDLLSTINNNLFVDDSQASLLERRVFGEGFSIQDSRKFQRFATVEAEKLLEILNDWMTTQEAFRRDNDHGHKVRLGLGVYVFEDQQSPQNGSEDPHGGE